jgi:ribonucleoside-diphosphate reductase beta chain
MIAGYVYYLALARAAQWDAADVDLAPDAIGWRSLGATDRRRVSGLVAGFCVAEAAVAEHLCPFERAAAPEAAACLRVQRVDEQRHAAFFDRVAREVLGAPGETAADRLEHLRGQLPERFVHLFGARLPRMARAVAGDGAALSRGVGLYHMVLEGIVLSIGQLSLLELLPEGGELPGLRSGVELVLRDERWHIGFGARLLQDLELTRPAFAAILRDGRVAAEAWADLASPEVARRAAQLHRRRLQSLGPRAQDADPRIAPFRRSEQ